MNSIYLITYTLGKLTSVWDKSLYYFCEANHDFVIEFIT